MKIFPDIIVSYAISFCNKIKDIKKEVKIESEQITINNLIIDFIYNSNIVFLTISNKDSVQLLSISFELNSSEESIKEALNSTINSKEDILINQIYDLNTLKNT